MVNKNGSSCSYGESEQHTEHPEHTHEAEERVVGGTQEDHVVEKENDVKQLTAEGTGIVKHQEVIGSVNVHRNLLMTLSESFDIRVTHLL